MRRVTEIDVGELLRFSKKNTGDAYVRLFRDAGLYTTIGEDTEYTGILLIWKMRDALQLLQKAEALYQSSRHPSIFSLSSIVPIVWWYGIALIVILGATFGTVSGFVLFWYVAGGSALVGLCLAILREVQRKSMQKYRKIQCQLLKKRIYSYIQEFSQINFCCSVGTHSLVIHHPQRKKIVSQLQMAQRKRVGEQISAINEKLQLYDQKMRNIIDEHQQGYMELEFLMDDIDCEDYLRDS